MPESGRVIAGMARGVRLEGAPSGTRPLSDRVKQALFASLESAGALSGGFLDLFAGTGAAGIEALSRGATRATFVENNSRACALIASNLKRTGLDGGQVVCAEVRKFLVGDGSPEPYAAVFIDPPYDETLVEPTLQLLGDATDRWLVDEAVAVAKHFWKDEPAETIGALTRTRQKRFGETMLSFYTRAE
jgi:16S rRNA (guanine966-N2)-methyltransferase